MKRRIYIISPFYLSEYPWNWKVYYCVELFSTLAQRDYIVNWIQPGKSILNFSLFPSLTHWRKFFVINIGNLITYRWLMPFFLSRLKQVSQSIRPFILFEIVDNKPFDLNLDEVFLNIPLIFSLGDKWLPSDDFPGPVVIPNKQLLNNLRDRGVPEKYLNHVPLGVYSNKRATNSEDIHKKIEILIWDKNTQLESFVKKIRQERPEYTVQYIDSKRLSYITSGEFHNWFQDMIGNRKTISILDKGLFHIGMELLSNGEAVFVPSSEVVNEEIKGKFYFYNNVQEVLQKIDTLLTEQPHISFPDEKKNFPIWGELGTILDKLIVGLVSEWESFVQREQIYK